MSCMPLRQSRFAAFFLCLFAAITNLTHAAGGRFDFLPAGNPLGWGRENNCTLEAAPGQPLTVRATGRDPYFFSPSVSMPGVKSGELILRAAFEGGVGSVRVYFVTDLSPQWGEDKTIATAVRADGTMREVRIPVGQHDKWRGTILDYRFDLEPDGPPGSVMRLASVAYDFVTEPRIGDVRTSDSVLVPGAATPMSVSIVNVSPNPVDGTVLRIEPRGGVVSVTPNEIELDRIDVESETVARAKIQATDTGVAVLDAVLVHNGKEVTRRSVAVCVSNGGIDPKTPAYASDVRPAGAPWALVKSPEQALAIGLDSNSGLAEWWAAREGSYERVGRAFPLVSLLHGEEQSTLDVVRWQSARAGGGDLILAGDLGKNAEAAVTARFQPARVGPWISAQVTLTAKRRIYLRAFASPRLLVGDGAFGADRDEGLLPGIEYLERGERSSSKLDYHTPEYLRTVPHPKKFCATLAAITRGDLILALMWPQPEAEGDGLRMPAAGFASPNFVDGQANHLMTLFWPTVPGEVRENEWVARSPVVIEPGQSRTLRYELVAHRKPEMHVTAAVPLWLERYGKPVVQDVPRDEEAELALSRSAYTDSVWNENNSGWHHALPGNNWPPHPFPFNIQFLETERARLKRGAKRDRVDRIIQEAIARRLEQTGGRPGGEDYWFAGEDLLKCVAAREGQVSGIIRSQRPDGSWGFNPGDERRKTLGEAGETEVGLVAQPALILLRHALMTGDEQAAVAGLKALEHMKRYVVPRAAQVWEIAVHTPDIVGSAHAATAYRLGYLLTGKREYLERAEYWIDTGLPFVYYWGHPRYPYWKYATIPVLGATFFVAPNWEGLPVQWCGLVYAEEVLRVAELNGSELYKTVGDGIVRSGMWQQHTDGEYKGLLPDSYTFGAKQGNPAFINPETILRPWWLLRGYDFRINSVVVPRGDDRSLRVSALGCIVKAEANGEAAVRVELRVAEGVPCGVLICGLKNEPAAVTWSGQSVPKQQQLARTTIGHRWLPDQKWLILNLIGTGSVEELLFR